MVYSEQALKNMNKNDLIKLVVQLEQKDEEREQRQDDFASLTNEIREALKKFSMLEADLAIAKNVNNILKRQIVDLERQTWETSQYARRESLEFAGIPSSVSNDNLEEKVIDILEKIGVKINKRDIQSCHRLHDKDRTIVKFSNRKDSLLILRSKKQLKELSSADLGLPEKTKLYINESLCPYYRGLWNKCKWLKTNKHINSFYTISGIVKIKVTETSRARSITHVNDLVEMFPAIDFDNK